MSPASDELGPTLETFYDRIHPEDRDRVRDVVETALREGRGSWSHQYRARRHDGSYATVLGRGQVVADASGRPTRLVGGITDITARVEAEREVTRSREVLRALSARLQKLREDERTRIAREIHDELGQLLTGVRLNLRWAENRLSEGSWPSEANRVLDRLVEATELTDQILASVRRIAADLRPSVLDTLGLFTALRQEAARFEKQAGIPCRLDLPESAPPLPPELRTAVFRIYQEALTNVSRHAQATEVVTSFHAEAGRGRLEVRDNGIGLGQVDAAGARSLGIVGMRERANGIGGTLTLRPADGRGTTVCLEFPLPVQPAPSA